MKKRILYAILIMGIACVVTSSVYSLNGQQDNIYSQKSNNVEVGVSPVHIYGMGPVPSNVKIEVTIQGQDNFSHVDILFSGNGHLSEAGNYSFTPRPFFTTYVSLPPDNSGNGGVLDVQVNNNTIQVPITVTGTYLNLLAEGLLYLGIGLICAFFLLQKFSLSRTWLLIPVYLFLSVFYGQRYDMYFLLSSGFRVIFGTSPYIPSANLLPGLQWTYPPGYIPWSYLVDKLYLLFHGFPGVSNTTLNFIGTEYGQPYGAWRSLAGFNLIVLYFLLKIPMVAAFFWTHHVLKKLSGSYNQKLWLINPLVVIVAVLWGQLDILAVAFMLQALLSYRSGYSGRAVLFASIGAAFKIFPALLIPFFVLTSKNKVRTSAGVLPVLFLVIAIYEFTGGITSSVYGLLFARSIPTFAGIFVSNGLTWQVMLPYLGIKSFPSLFLYFFVPAYLVLTVVSVMKKVRIEDYAILMFMLFFLSYNFVNPQYLIWVIPLMVITSREKWARNLSLLGLVFMILTYSYTYFMNPQISWHYSGSMVGQLEALKVYFLGSGATRAVIGLCSTILFAYMAFKLVRHEFFTSGNPPST